jgi:hypothetical protein
MYPPVTKWPWPAYLESCGGLRESFLNSEGTVPSDLSTAAGNTVASSSQLGPPKSCSTGKHSWCTTMKVIWNSDGQEVWDISSEDCSDSENNATPPVKKLCKHGHHTKTTILHTTAGEEVWDINSEEYSYSGSEGQELI